MNNMLALSLELLITKLKLVVVSRTRSQLESRIRRYWSPNNVMNNGGNPQPGECVRSSHKEIHVHGIVW